MTGELLNLKRCFDILDNYKAPEMTKRHSIQVAKISYLIGKKFLENNVDISLKDLVCSSLLHDLFKIVEVKLERLKNELSADEYSKKIDFWEKLKKNQKVNTHETAFYQKFKNIYPKIAKIVLNHRYYQINEGFESWEEKIVYYADKLVMFDKITTLKERLDEAHLRYAYKYPQTEESKQYIQEIDNKIFALEKEIFKISRLSPNELIKLNDIEFDELIKGDLFG